MVQDLLKLICIICLCASTAYSQASQAGVLVSQKIAAGGGGIVIDQLNVGEAADDAGSTTIVMTTSNAVASNGFIVLQVGWFHASATLSSVSGGSLTWTIDVQGGNGSSNIAIVSAQAPSGLASSTAITATYSASVNARALVGTSFTGVATSSPVDTTTGPTTQGTDTPWATNSTTIVAGSLFVGGAVEAVTDLTSTVTSPSIEAHDVNGGAGTFTATMCYRIESSGGSYTVAGTWSSAAGSVVAGVAYKKA